MLIDRGDGFIIKRTSVLEFTVLVVKCYIDKLAVS